MTIIRILGVLACLGGTALPRLAASQATPPPIQADSVTVLLRFRYDSGFARITSLVPDSSRSSPYWPLWALGRFRQLHVRWATLRDTQFFALEPGSPAGGWLAIIPPGHALLHTRGGTITLDPSPTLYVVTIRPEDVTELWAGVLLVHAVSQLADRVLGATPRDATRDQILLSDFRAYELELIAADLIAKGALRSLLDSLLARAQARSIDELARRAPPMAIAHLAHLNALLPAGDPRSEAEATLRAGFFAMALLIRHAERHGLAPEAILEAIDHVKRSASAQ